MTFLPTVVIGRWFYLYLILGAYGRKIVGFEVHDSDDAEHAAHLVRRTALAGGIHWPVLALIETASADLGVACGSAMLSAPGPRRCRMRVNPETEAADQGQTKPTGSGEAVSMGTAATISFPQASRRSWPRSGRRALGGV
ncbi:MAG: hypothetical protein Fur0014_11920 [Rubrivivax sp.]